MNPDPPASISPFVPTRWTLVLHAQGESPQARAALSELSECYYQPVYRFLQREGRSEDAARELTQEFFSRLLQRGQLGNVDPAKGRFRSYLLGAVKHFLADHRDHEQRLKRGGGQHPESLDLPLDETLEGLQVSDPSAAVPDAYFDRQWALHVMDRALTTLQNEFETQGKTNQFNLLKPWLAGNAIDLSQADTAARLGWTESALKVAIHRVRKRFRDTVRAEIAQTVGDHSDVDAELRYLVEVLAH
jgi:RNA polymerase sigma-70 factor (ECF subfamily)